MKNLFKFAFCLILYASCFSPNRSLAQDVFYLTADRLFDGEKIWTGSDRNSEVDFVCKTPTGDMEYYQVAWQMTDEKTIEREFSALEKIKDNYPKYLLTTDGFTQDRNGIRHLNVFHWLLNNKESQ